MSAADDSRIPAAVVVAMAVVAATVLVGAAATLGSYGWVLMMLTPICIGLFAGREGHERGSFLFILGLSILGGAVMAVTGAGLHGFLCTVIGLLYLTPPLFVGIVIGWAWKRSKNGPPSSPGAAAGVFLALVGGLALEARLTPEHAPETVVTSAVLPMERAEAWDAIVFYEDVPAPPPVLCALGLPRPIGTEGERDRVGALVRCLYETGSIDKVITELREGELLAFEVTRQEGVEDRSVALLSGSFTLEDAPGGTRVTLRTTYRPLLDARPLWRVAERAVCRDLHGHVLRGIALQEEAAAQAPDDVE